MRFNINKELRNPEKYRNKLNIDGCDKDYLLKLLKSMLSIRLTEVEIGNLVKEEVIHAPCHLCIGQEAVAVGVASHLSNQDKVFGCHRSHAHFLAQGGSIRSLIFEVLGKSQGASKGMGGSMHLIDQASGFYGSVPIVGATIPIAVGAALAERMKKSNFIAVAYFGDGACEEGVLHESLNLAAIYKLPILFVCENNLFSSHMDIDLRQPSDSMSRFATAHCIENYVVDGNDIIAVSDITKILINKVRNNMGPAFLEAITYRWRGHVGYKEDIDVGVNRKIRDINAWKKRDPINRLAASMIENNIISKSNYKLLEASIKNGISSIVEEAKIADYPSENCLLDCVYSRGKDA